MSNPDMPIAPTPEADEAETISMLRTILGELQVIECRFGALSDRLSPEDLKMMSLFIGMATLRTSAIIDDAMTEATHQRHRDPSSHLHEFTASQA
ncbi:MAG: hypothetical protein KF899_02580 [Parvibaculum sp.]|nr:hypothetical protein [Parvibaculum sp.]